MRPTRSACPWRAASSCLRDGAPLGQRCGAGLHELRGVRHRPLHHHPVRVRVTSSAPGEAPTELVCITGMHRSGTSLLARVANLLGVDLGRPDALMGPGPRQPGRVLGEPRGQGARRRGARPPRRRLGPASAARGRAGSSTRASTRSASGPSRSSAATSPGPPPGRVGCKEPRLCLLHPFWRTVVPISHTVVVVRHPIEVVASLVRRNGMDPGQGACSGSRYLLAVGAQPTGLSSSAARRPDRPARRDRGPARRPPRPARSPSPTASTRCGRRTTRRSCTAGRARRPRRPRHHGVAEPRPRAGGLERRRDRPRRALPVRCARPSREGWLGPPANRAALDAARAEASSCGEAPQVAPPAQGAGGGRPGRAPPPLPPFDGDDEDADP